MHGACRLYTMEINPEILITAVEERPVLWDKTDEGYKNKIKKYDAWKEVCQLLQPSFDEMESEEKNNFGQAVMKKWSNMRDSWMKCARKMKEFRSGSGSKNVKKYQYYEQMLFLKKICDHRETFDNMDSTNTDISIDSPTQTNLDIGSRNNDRKRNKRKAVTTEVDEQFLKFMKSTEEEEKSRIMGFFKSIAPSVDLFTDDNLIDFQIQVLQLIKNIKQKQEYNPCFPTYNPNLPSTSGFRSANQSNNRDIQSPRYKHPSPNHPNTSRQTCDVNIDDQSLYLPRPESQNIFSSAVDSASPSIESSESILDFDFST